MQLRFYGATDGTTGSCHALTVGGRTVLLECGQFQGPRAIAYRRNARFEFEPSAVAAVVLSHAHIDHSGKLPQLVRHGFHGKIHCTPPTRALCEPMLLDAAHIQLKDAEHLNGRRLRETVRSRRHVAHAARRTFVDEDEPPSLGPASLPAREVVPLYLAEDVYETLRLLRPHALGEWFEVVPGVRCRLHDAGHILGSSWVELECKEGLETRRIAFTGDYGRSQPILRDPEPLLPADVVISESTYGDRCHPPLDDTESQLEGAVARLAERGRGKLLIPAFAVGRTQSILYALENIFERAQFPSIPVVVDSPLAAKATAIVQAHPECFDDEARARLVRLQSGVHRRMRLSFTEGVEDSRRLNRDPGPVIIISASGMMESGRIVHHLAWSIGKRDTEIAVVGFQAAHTLGRRLVEGAREVNLLGRRHAVRARVTTMNGFSAHADRDGLLAALEPLAERARVLFLVHGEDDQRKPLARNLAQRGYRRVECPRGSAPWTL